MQYHLTIQRHKVWEKTFPTIRSCQIWSRKHGGTINWQVSDSNMVGLLWWSLWQKCGWQGPYILIDVYYLFVRNEYTTLFGSTATSWKLSDYCGECLSCSVKLIAVALAPLISLWFASPHINCFKAWYFCCWAAQLIARLTGLSTQTFHRFRSHNEV